MVEVTNGNPKGSGGSGAGEVNDFGIQREYGV